MHHLVVNVESQTPGRRRSRQEVESDVRAALLRLLGQGKPFKDLTVDELARAAGLSRTAFYFYFPGKNQVLMAALGDVTEELYGEAARWWHGEGPPEQLMRVALEGIVAVFQRHAALLRTSHEVTTYDAEFAAFYNDRVMKRFVSATADQLRRDRRDGRLRELDSDTVAEVLVWMVERCNNVLIGAQGRSPEQLVEAFTTVWVHALYPDAVVSAAS
jgi:TetR/AcrR family transcriptional regulator, ethionamide resistance regulator